ncbi:MAG: sensor histidine kinase, partial [Spirochaetales bacterium]|nr:sensor histidine kinase [Spirochaetales bacterium]
KLLLSDNYGFTSIREYLNNLIDGIINLFPDAINTIVEKHIADFKLDPKRLVPVGIIVNELLTNVMKYAFNKKESGLIEISVQEDSGKITITIHDNGIGLPNGFDLNKQTGFGLMLVKMLSEQLEGTFTIENYKGTKSTLKFSI